MPKHVVLFILMALLAAANPRAQDRKPAPYPVMAPVEQYTIASREAEIALGTARRSAVHPGLGRRTRCRAPRLRERDQGRERLRLLRRAVVDGRFDDPQFSSPKLRAANCFIAPTARSVLPQYLKRTEWMLAGATRQQVIDRTRAAFASHRFVTPEAGSFSFMLSKAGYVSDDAAGPWLPHLMFFVRSGQTAAWGCRARRVAKSSG